MTNPPLTNPPLRILIADDSRPLRTVAVHMLGKFGQCHEACDGREAVAAYAAALDRGEPFQLVVLDILMPRLNGMDALRDIRRLERAKGLDEDTRAKVVMLTSLDDPRFMLDAQLDAQADYYLTKPFDSGQMREALTGLGLVPTDPVQDLDPACGGEPDATV